MQRKIKRRPQSGFSVIEVLMALGLLSIAFGVLGTFGYQYAQSQKTTIQKDEALRVKAIFETYFSSPEFCKDTLVDGVGKGELTLDELIVGKNVSQVGDVDLLSLGRKGGMKISNILWRARKSDKKYAIINDKVAISELVVSFDGGQNETAIAPSSVVIPLFLDMNSEVIHACSLAPRGVGAMTLAGCASGKFITGTQNAGTLRCVDFPETRCPEKKRLGGISMDGKGFCVDFK